MASDLRAPLDTRGVRGDDSPERGSRARFASRNRNRSEPVATADPVCPARVLQVRRTSREGLAERVRIVVVMPAGPGEDVTDMLDSVRAFVDPPGAVVLVDGSGTHRAGGRDGR
jgi:hypothetical protein